MSNLWVDDGRIGVKRRFLADVEGVLHHPDFYLFVEEILF
jgi:hypothetical protein